MMHEFFQSVRVAFAENRGGSDAALMALAGLVLLWLAAQGLGWLRRRSSKRSALEEFVAQRGLADEALPLARELGRLVAAEPLEVLTELPRFEEASALALDAAARREGSPPAELLAGLRRLRQAAGFDRVAAWSPLLSSRELAAGTVVKVGGQRGRVIDVSEASFSLELDGPPALEPGVLVVVELTHAREARYQLRCRPLASREVDGARWGMLLAHDEVPLRVQKREYVRVATTGPIVVQPMGGRADVMTSRAEQTGQLLDVSGGGLCCTFPAPIQVGMVVLARFSVDGQSFQGLRAMVLSSVPQATAFQIRFAFAGLDELEGERLVAAVTRLSGQVRGGGRH
jgi:hypothetical protein